MSIIYKLQNISSSKLRGCNTLLDRAFLLCFKSSPETNTLISNEFNAILQPGEEVVKVALRVPLRSAAQVRISSKSLYYSKSIYSFNYYIQIKN